jgi:predicted Zn-dependent protease
VDQTAASAGAGRIDPEFTAYPLRELAGAALERAAQLGAEHADFRAERIRGQQIGLSDGHLETLFDTDDVGLAVRVVVGERLAALPLTLRSDPWAPGLECAPFVIAHASGRDSSVFDNGLPLAPTDWISAGQLAGLTQTRHSAQRAGMAVTPPIGNLILAAPGTTASLDDMIARTERGLLLTCLWYIRPVDLQSLLVTGLTRDGVYLVEKGEVPAGVNNFRFNESPVAMLARLTEAGATAATLPREWADYFTRAMPPVRVEGFNMSSVSQAS